MTQAARPDLLGIWCALLFSLGLCGLGAMRLSDHGRAYQTLIHETPQGVRATGTVSFTGRLVEYSTYQTSHWTRRHRSGGMGLVVLQSKRQRAWFHVDADLARQNELSASLKKNAQVTLQAIRRQYVAPATRERTGESYFVYDLRVAPPAPAIPQWRPLITPKQFVTHSRNQIFFWGGISLFGAVFTGILACKLWRRR